MIIGVSINITSEMHAFVSSVMSKSKGFDYRNAAKIYLLTQSSIVGSYRQLLPRFPLTMSI